jgi:hypothetical protein
MCEGNQTYSHTADRKSCSSNFTVLEILKRSSAIPGHGFWDRYEDRTWDCGYVCRGSEEHIFSPPCMYCDCLSGYGKGCFLYTSQLYQPQKFPILYFLASQWVRQRRIICDITEFAIYITSV